MCLQQEFDSAATTMLTGTFNSGLGGSEVAIMGRK